jgi:hypothetical protein
MADGIFTDDELKAQEATEQTALETPVETDEQKAERERDEQGPVQGQGDG